MLFADFIRQVKKKNITRPVCLIGDELFQRNYCLDTIKKNYLDSVQKVDSLPDSALWEEAVLSRDLFCSEKVLIVRNAEGCFKLPDFLSSLTELPPDLVFVGYFQKLDKKKQKQLEEVADIIEAREPYEREWGRWKTFFEAELELPIEDRLWSQLGLWYQRKLQICHQELKKLALYQDSKKSLNSSDYEMLISQNLGDVFDFVAQVVEKNRASAHASYLQLIQSGESDIKLVSLLISQFEKLLEVNHLWRQKVHDPKEIARHLGVHPFFVSKIISQAQRYQPDELEQTLSELSDVDFKLKQGKKDLYHLFLLPFLRA